MDKQKELEYYLNREYNKLKIVFESVKFVGDREDLWELIISYWEDCKYFYGSGEIVKAFELINYIWGMLDILANLGYLEIPERIRKWFKIDPK